MTRRVCICHTIKKYEQHEIPTSIEALKVSSSIYENVHT